MFIYCTYQPAVANENQQCCHYTDNGYKFVSYGCGTWPVNDRRTQTEVVAEQKSTYKKFGQENGEKRKPNNEAHQYVFFV